jgi:hypothetical protein
VAEWQTRKVESLVVATPYWFKSSLPDHIFYQDSGEDEARISHFYKWERFNNSRELIAGEDYLEFTIYLLFPAKFA